MKPRAGSPFVRSRPLALTKNEIKYAVKVCAKYIYKHFVNEDVVVVYILKGITYFFVDLTRKLTNCYFIEALRNIIVVLT